MLCTQSRLNLSIYQFQSVVQITRTYVLFLKVLIKGTEIKIGMKNLRTKSFSNRIVLAYHDVIIIYKYHIYVYFIIHMYHNYNLCTYL